MGFVRVHKNKAYFKRFQPKFRRRREGKTDYAARRCFIAQAKDKYGALKKRFVVRLTGTKIQCQIVYSTLAGDHVMEVADSNELQRYGITFGLRNYAAAYATGLLLARRILQKMKLDKKFAGQETVDGTEFHQEEVDNARPLKCNLDVGITRTTTGNRVFAAMKGAVDGGLNIPHGVKRFPGYDNETKEFHPEVLRDRIFGKHVADYMINLKENDPERYNTQFSRFIKNNTTADQIENLYIEAHKKIRADPSRPKRPERPPVSRKREGKMIITPRTKYIRDLKISCAKRKERVAKKIQMVAEAVAAS